MTPNQQNFEIVGSNAERKKEICEKKEEFISSYVPKKIDLQKYKDAKRNQDNFVFTRAEIMEELDWKNGTFYNRMRLAYPFFKDDPNKENLYFTRVKEDGDKTEKLLFSYKGFYRLLRVYFSFDLKGGTINTQQTVKEEKETVKNESVNTQNDSNVDNIIELYQQMIQDKDDTIKMLREQVEELTNIIRVKEQKDLEMAKADFLTKQKQLLINDAEGNKKQSLFERIFGRKKRGNAEE